MDADDTRNPFHITPLLGASAGFVALIVMIAVFAPWISPYPLGGLDEKRLLESPSWAHWLGTDGLGRDLFTRVLYGARVSLTVGLGTSLIAFGGLNWALDGASAPVAASRRVGPAMASTGQLASGPRPASDVSSPPAWLPLLFLCGKKPTG